VATVMCIDMVVGLSRFGQKVGAGTTVEQSSVEQQRTDVAGQGKQESAIMKHVH